ncbi:hypothetical protein U9M48_021751, partial [Paspalum notatum var. saurae]
KQQRLQQRNHTCIAEFQRCLYSSILLFQILGAFELVGLSDILGEGWQSVTA